MNIAKIINLPKIEDPRGNLTFIEENNHIPFEIERVYWVYDVPGGELRGGHAFKQSNEFIVAISGSFDVILHNGQVEEKYSLNRSYYGLFVPKMHWRSLENFSTNALCLIITDTNYDATDYIRNFHKFKLLTNG